MRIQRLFRMMPAEIAYRSWQEAYKTMTRLSISVSDATYQPPQIFDFIKPGEGCDDIIKLFKSGHDKRAADGLLERFKHFAPARFFAGATDGLVADIINIDCPLLRKQIIESADAVCKGQFRILGYGRLSFGTPVDWHRDPVSHCHSPLIHWSRIDPLNTAQVGDSKVIWELNRHQWLLDLGQAYRFTGDEHYAQEFAQQIRHWIQNNPAGLGINWSSSLEVAMRMMSWCWALLLFHGSQALTAGLLVEMLAWIRLHANYIERYLSYYFSPNTHLTGEALGLFYVGLLFPEIQGAARWRAVSVKILEEQIERQVHSDGVYFEQSTRYQYYTVEIYLHFTILAQRNGITVSDKITRRLQLMLDFLLAVRRPDGSLPQIGDADGGWLMPFVRRAPDDFDGLFAAAAAVFKRADYAWAAHRFTPEALWLLGLPGRDVFQDLPAEPPAENSLQVFKDGGYVLMRSGWHSNAHQLIFDAGPLGCAISSGHGHADLLSIQCSVYGENYLVDAGTCCYSATGDWRNYFRSTSAHSTIMIDGLNQAQPSGPFSWHSKPWARLLKTRSTQTVIYADACHDAWRELEDPVTHRRRVLFVKPDYWVIVDDLSGKARHRIDLRYQFAPLHVALENSNWIRARGRLQHGLLIRSFSTAELDCNIKAGALNPIQGWISPDYGHRMSAPVVNYSATTLLPLRIVTILFPVKDADAPAPDIKVLIDKGMISGLIICAEADESNNEGRRTIHINEFDVNPESS